MKATLSHCKRCGKIHPKMYNDYCPDCVLKEEKNVKIIKEFLSKVPDIKSLSIEDISRNTGVSTDDILLYVKRRRLLDLFNVVRLKCKICGLEINLSSNQNFLCPKCNMQVSEIIEEQGIKAEKEKYVALKKNKEEDNKPKYGLKKYKF